MAAKKSQAEIKTRRRIMELLKLQGAAEAAEIAAELELTAMAVRQHLYQLQEEQLVCHEQVPRAVGRPAKAWKLTSAADELFPNAHAALAVDLVSSLTETFGQQGLEKLIRARAQQQIEHYRASLPKRASLLRKLKALAELRTGEGYMAEVVESEEGDLMLVENHCPICTAATACTLLCSAELEVFQAVLGDAVEVERSEYILEGDRRCAYLVRRAQ